MPTTHLTDFTFDNDGNLVITVTPEAHAEVAAWDDQDTDAAFLELIQDQLVNGWEVLRPEDIGALTDALILSDEVTRNEDGVVVDVGRLFSNIGWYQVYSAVEEALTADGAVFHRVHGATTPA